MLATAPASLSRTRNYLRQIGGSFVFKTLAVGLSFLALPMIIGYLGQERYGVWSTLLGVISWAAFFDLGIGNGLRNKVAETLAKEQRSEAALYISSAYTLIAALAIALWIAIMTATAFVPWRWVFNTNVIAEYDLRLTVQIVASFMLLNFWIGLIGALFYAIQKTAMISLGQLLSNALSLGMIWVLTAVSHPSLVFLACAFGMSLVISNVALSAWFFARNIDLRPRFNFALAHLRPIMSLGVQFFLIQVSGLVLFTTDKLLIAQFFGPEYVTRYDVTFKMFSIITVLHALICSPLWSAYTEAYHKNDLGWIRKMLRRQLGVFVLLAVGVALLAFFAKPIARFWVGSAVEVDQATVLAMAVLVIISTWTNVFNIPLIGIGKIRLSSVYCILTAALNIPLAWGLAVFAGLGTSGVVLATALAIMVGGIISPLQLYYFIFTKQSSPLLTNILR